MVSLSIIVTMLIFNFLDTTQQRMRLITQLQSREDKSSEIFWFYFREQERFETRSRFVSWESGIKCYQLLLQPKHHILRRIQWWANLPPFQMFNPVTLGYWRASAPLKHNPGGHCLFDDNVDGSTTVHHIKKNVLQVEHL